MACWLWPLLHRQQSKRGGARSDPEITQTAHWFMKQAYPDRNHKQHAPANRNRIHYHAVNAAQRQGHSQLAASAAQSHQSSDDYFSPSWLAMLAQVNNRSDGATG